MLEVTFVWMKGWAVASGAWEEGEMAIGVGPCGGLNWEACVALVALGMLRRRLFTVAAEGRFPSGLGLRLLILPIGLVKPLRRPASMQGATTAISSDTEAVRIAAALSRTEGTLCSSCSVVFERGIRCGFRGCAAVCGGEGQTMGSMSRSNMADEDEWLWSEGEGKCAANRHARNKRTRRWVRRGLKMESVTPDDLLRGLAEGP
jgi:hypothetical protein